MYLSTNKKIVIARRFCKGLTQGANVKANINKEAAKEQQVIREAHELNGSAASSLMEKKDLEERGRPLGNIWIQEEAGNTQSSSELPNAGPNEDTLVASLRRRGAGVLGLMVGRDA